MANNIKNIIAKMDKNSLRECVIRNLTSDYFYDLDDSTYHLNKKTWEVYATIFNAIKKAFPGLDETPTWEDGNAISAIENALKGIVAARANLVNDEIKVFFRGKVIDSFDPKGMSWVERVERIGKSMDKCDVFFFYGDCASVCGFNTNKVIVE